MNSVQERIARLVSGTVRAINIGAALSFLVVAVSSAAIWNQRIVDLASALMFLVVPTLVALAIVILDFRRPAWRGWVAVLLLCVSVPFYLAEIYLRARSAIGVPAMPQAERVAEETMTDAVLRLRAAGQLTYPAPSPNYFKDEQKLRSVDLGPREIVPLGGVGNAQHVLCKRSQGWLTYRADRHGFRNDDEIWNSPNWDIVFVGDSYVHGHCHDDDHHFVSLVRKRAESAVNLGVRGSGPLTQLAALREYWRERKAKHLIWVFFEGNDFADLRAEIGNTLLARYVDDPLFSQGLIDRQEDVDRALGELLDRTIEGGHWLDGTAVEGASFVSRMKSFVLEFVKLQELRKNLFRDINARGLAPPNYGALERVLTAAKVQAAANDAEFTFVYLGYEPVSDRPSAVRDRVLALVNKLKIRIVDMDAVFRSEPDRDKYFGDHFTSHGQRALAEAVLQAIGR